jgi:hypothetical protein
MSVPRNRLDSLAVDDVPGIPTVKIPIARLKYAGNWDPEPWAWQRMAKLFRKQTNAGLGSCLDAARETVAFLCLDNEVDPELAEGVAVNVNYRQSEPALHHQSIGDYTLSQPRLTALRLASKGNMCLSVE